VVLDLWQPLTHLPIGLALLTALALGVVHGVTPDEHTWPITFSYAIGSYSTRRGLAAGLMFSAAFTVQRAIASELAYLSLARWMQAPRVDAVVYVLVGLAMTLAGRHVLRGRALWRLSLPAPADAAGGAGGVRPIPLPMAALHGFIAGWGVGAFATILYTVLAPAMPSAALGWAPGFCFGLGTLAVQATAGALFGRWSRRRGMPEEMGQTVATRVAGRTLAFGGAAFVGAGLLALVAPGVAGAAVLTPLHVHNLHSLGLGFVLAVGIVLGIGVVSLVTETRRALRSLRTVGAP